MNALDVVGEFLEEFSREVDTVDYLLNSAGVESDSEGKFVQQQFVQNGIIHPQVFSDEKTAMAADLSSSGGPQLMAAMSLIGKMGGR